MNQHPRRVIGGVVLLAASLLTIGCGGDSASLSYAEFLTEIEAQNVEQVTIGNGLAIVNILNPRESDRVDSNRLQFVVSMPVKTDSELIKLLRKHKVPFRIQR